MKRYTCVFTMVS